MFDSNDEALAKALVRGLQTDLGNVVVRRESALPIRAAEQKAGAVGLPVWQGDYCAVAVYEIAPPFRWNLASELTSRVEIQRHDNGLMTVVYLFPRTAEITKWIPTSVSLPRSAGCLCLNCFPRRDGVPGKTGALMRSE